jgi:hypothetical protein
MSGGFQQQSCRRESMSLKWFYESFVANAFIVVCPQEFAAIVLYHVR